MKGNPESIQRIFRKDSDKNVHTLKKKKKIHSFFFFFFSWVLIKLKLYYAASDDTS